MEVGAVKQAYNNEVILLKKSLNQARLHTIHKLTRKAKTFTEKKAPEKLKEKLKRKAESAINEVLLIKKIKPKEIAKFIVTHKGELKDYLNKPKVDKEKACARLLLHKSLQDKYKFIRERFSNVRIEDLLMSRQERIKLKKEAKEQQKQKKAKKNKNIGNSEGEWNIENIEINDDSKQCRGDLSDDAESMEHDVKNSSDDNNNASDDSDDKSDEEMSIKNENIVATESVSEEEEDINPRMSENDEESSDSNEGNEQNHFGKFVKITPSKANVEIKNYKKVGNTDNVIVKHTNVGNAEKKSKDTKKNKNLNEKLLSRKFKKDIDISATKAKIVDPFFITATGENYMTVAEPRQPDEVKEIHKQGNRRLRRAVMFGHAPKIKPKQDKFRPQNYSSQQNSYERSEKTVRTNNKWTKDGNDKKSNFSERNSNFEDRRSNFSDKNSKFSRIQDEKPEKLHPSWEAKRKQSGILPFQGKKTVFDDS